jgi:hypothetical protein
MGEHEQPMPMRSMLLGLVFVGNLDKNNLKFIQILKINLWQNYFTELTFFAAPLSTARHKYLRRLLLWRDTAATLNE